LGLEYIGQLEGEIAAKVAEADELKVKNEELMAENTRLTDLTRMLLSSPAFSSFLSDLSGNGVALPPTVQNSPSSMVKAGQPSATRKDVNPHQIVKQQVDSRQDVAQIGMPLIPETTFDYGTLESTSNMWAEGNMDFSLYDAQVFTVMELPQGPAVDQLDSGMLAGKSSYSASSYVTDDEPKHELPIVERMPVLEKDGCDDEPKKYRDDVEIDESDPAFALFADCLFPATSLAPAGDITLFGSIEPEKAFGRVEIVLQEQVDGCGKISAGTMEKFERIYSSLEAASKRIAALIPHS
jgi:bZIP-type transcription factor MBZ1